MGGDVVIKCFVIKIIGGFQRRVIPAWSHLVMACCRQATGGVACGWRRGVSPQTGVDGGSDARRHNG